LVTAPLWDFGRQSAQELKAAAQVFAADTQSAEGKEILRVRTARFYIAAAAASDVVAELQDQLRNADVKLKAVTQSYLRGERPQTDVVRLKVELGKAQLQVRRAQDDERGLQLQVSQLIGSSDSFALKPLSKRSLEHWQWVLKRLTVRPQETAAIERLRSNKALLESELSALDAEGLPVISGSAGVQALGTLTPLKPEFLVQLSVQHSLPLSSARDFKKESVLARLRENRLSLDEEMKNRSDKIQQSQRRMESLLQQLELQKVQIAMLLEHQKLIRARYFAGRASLLELSNTEDELLANRLELTRLNAGLYTAAVDAFEALGGKDLETLFQ
jgi:outer membrane protein TolC